MNDTVERTLYIILLLVFIGVGIAVYVAISFGAKLDQQLKDAAEQRKAQQTTLNQLEQDNAQQTEYIKCLLTAQNLGDYSTADCNPPRTAPISLAPGQAPTTSVPASPNPAGSNRSSSAPTPIPSLIQTLTELVKSL